MTQREQVIQRAKEWLALAAHYEHDDEVVEVENIIRDLLSLVKDSGEPVAWRIPIAGVHEYASHPEPLIRERKQLEDYEKSCGEDVEHFEPEPLYTHPQQPNEPSDEVSKLAVKLVNAVISSDFNGISCLDIKMNGKQENWFDARNRMASMIATFTPTRAEREIWEGSLTDSVKYRAVQIPATPENVEAMGEE